MRVEITPRDLELLAKAVDNEVNGMGSPTYSPGGISKGLVRLGLLEGRNDNVVRPTELGKRLISQSCYNISDFLSREKVEE